MPDPDNSFANAVAADFSEEEITENPTATPPKQDDPATPPASDDNAEEPKEDDPANSEDPNKENEEPETPPTNPAKPAEEDPANPQDPATPPAQDEPKPLTEEGVLRLLNQARHEEQDNAKALEKNLS